MSLSLLQKEEKQTPGYHRRVLQNVHEVRVKLSLGQLPPRTRHGDADNCIPHCSMTSSRCISRWSKTTSQDITDQSGRGRNDVPAEGPTHPTSLNSSAWVVFYGVNRIRVKVPRHVPCIIIRPTSSIGGMSRQIKGVDKVLGSRLGPHIVQRIYANIARCDFSSLSLQRYYWNTSLTWSRFCRLRSCVHRTIALSYGPASPLRAPIVHFSADYHVLSSQLS